MCFWQQISSRKKDKSIFHTGTEFCNGIEILFLLQFYLRSGLEYWNFLTIVLDYFRCGIFYASVLSNLNYLAI